MEKALISQLHKAMDENNEYCDRGLAGRAAMAAGFANGLGYALGLMGVKVTICNDSVIGYGRITKMEIEWPEANPTPAQEVAISKSLLLCRPLVELGEALKESCPPNDCVIYRNVYEMYCEKLADYKRILAACPVLSDSTTRALEHAIRTDEIQLYDMWKENIAVNRKREAIRCEKEQKARIAAKAME